MKFKQSIKTLNYEKILLLLINPVFGIDQSNSFKGSNMTFSIDSTLRGKTSTGSNVISISPEDIRLQTQFVCPV
jgi:hypothetical protein